MATVKVHGTDRSTHYSRAELDAISLRYVALDGEVGQGSAPIPDPTGALEPYAGQSFQFLVGATGVFDGFVGPLQRDRGESATGDRLVNTYSIGDENAVLHGFRAYKWIRPAETTRARYLAFLAAFVPWVTSTTWVTTHVVENMAKKTYSTETLHDELFQEIADLTGNTAFVENHRGHLHPFTVGIAGGLSFSDTSFDFVTSFPLAGPKRSKDPLDLRNDVLVETPGGHYTATDATSISRHDSDGLEHQGLVLLSEGTALDAQKKALAIVAAQKVERVTYEFDTGPMTAAQFASIPVGCLVTVTSAVLGLSGSTQRIGGLTATYRTRDRIFAHVELGYPRRAHVKLSRGSALTNTALRPCCPPWDGIGTPGTNQDVINELAWTGDGTTTSGTTAFPYIAGTLGIWVAGLNVTSHKTEVDPTTGAFSLSFAPTSGQTVRLNYSAA